MATGSRRRFSWLAFMLVLLVLAPFSHHWLSLRYYGEKGFTINWYEEMVAPAFHAVGVVLPLAAAIAAGRLMALRGLKATIGAVALTAVTSLALLRGVSVFTAWDAENGAMAERTCRLHLKQLAVAMELYARSNCGRLPPDAAWPDAVTQMGDLKHLLRCPADDSDGHPSYALNERAAGAELASIDEDMPLFFDAAGDVAPPSAAVLRHPRRWAHIVPIEPGVNVVYANGHAEWVGRSQWERRFGAR